MTLSPEAAALPLSPKERRERNRREMAEAILAAARAVMQEHGVAALNLTEVARRVRLRPQSLAEYFPTKAAVYDALYERAFHLYREGDERAYRGHPPG
ncbi:MAG: TetR family transcriptional regulator, partial [Chloroflexota bacterium]|nr:TetR family transcriptional regulator [Chloroflexota bacterium]